mmetsp:Transcript_19970/g.46921  ORF Transcript_19970/g.46921 Transcript_19970/m.46921 type:complete len:205 (-) Transcript_19970:131-745(-)
MLSPPSPRPRVATPRRAVSSKVPVDTIPSVPRFPTWTRPTPESVFRVPDVDSDAPERLLPSSGPAVVGVGNRGRSLHFRRFHCSPTTTQTRRRRLAASPPRRTTRRAVEPADAPAGTVPGAAARPPLLQLPPPFRTDSTAATAPRARRRPGPCRRRPPPAIVPPDPPSRDRLHCGGTRRRCRPDRHGQGQGQGRFTSLWSYCTV